MPTARQLFAGATLPAVYRKLIERKDHWLAMARGRQMRMQNPGPDDRRRSNPVKRI
jgi:hypothetical protein